MERFLNIIHFCFYSIDCYVSIAVMKINPIMMMYKIPMVKRWLEKKNRNPEETYKDGFNNVNYGISIMRSGGLMLALITFFISGILLLSFPELLHLIRVVMICAGIFSYLICHIYIFRKDKFKQYISSLKKTKKKKLFWYYILSLSILAGTARLYIYSVYHASHKPSIFQMIF